MPAPQSAPEENLQALMSGYQDGDKAAASRLIEQVSPLLRRYFLVHAADRRYADDLFQETWMRIHKARHTYRRAEPVLPWIFAIARHTSLDTYRRARRVEIREWQVDSLPEPAQLRPESTGAELNMMLTALPESQREVIVLLKIFGMTIEEVAHATSSTTGAVKQKAFRAYQKLRDVLSPGMKEK
jgi:RNA polymerase sigma-70 factor, ECF subfamily